MRKVSRVAEQVLAAMLSVGAVLIAVGIITACATTMKMIYDILR